MLASVVLYTSANLCVKELAGLGTFQLVFLRSALSLAVCLVYLKAHNLPILGHNRMWLVVRGLAGMVGLSGFFHTVRHIPLASATVIQYFSPVFTVVLALLFMGEKVQKSNGFCSAAPWWASSWSRDLTPVCPGACGGSD